MSARASAYAKALVVCPNGERISRGEKLVLIVLADNHQDKAKSFTYPSLETIAEDALCDRRSCQRHLAALEVKGVLRRMRPAGQGRGTTVFYFFTALDAIPEGWQNAALYGVDSGGVSHRQKGGKRAAEGRQKGDIPGTSSITNINRNEELKASPPNPPQAGGEDLTAEQAAHLERCRPELRAGFEAAYLESNRNAALAAQDERANAKRADELRLAMPDEPSAAAWVMRECGWVDDGRKRGLYAAIAAVLRAESESGRAWGETAEAIAHAWRDYKLVMPMLRVAYGPKNFVREALWRDRARWVLDERKLRERHARVGS